MIKIIIIIVITFCFNVLNSADFKVSLGGKGVLKDAIEFPNGDEKYVIWTSQNTFTTNTYMYGSSECSGGFQMKNGTEMTHQYVLCKGMSQDGHYYLSRHTNIGDFSASIDAFEYIDGTGPWKELIGAKCTGAFLNNMENNYFLWNAQCKIPDQTLQRIKDYATKKD